jgi:hypothetical protein
MSWGSEVSLRSQQPGLHTRDPIGVRGQPWSSDLARQNGDQLRLIDQGRLPGARGRSRPPEP